MTACRFCGRPASMALPICWQCASPTHSSHRKMSVNSTPYTVFATLCQTNVVCRPAAVFDKSRRRRPTRQDERRSHSSAMATTNNARRRAAGTHELQHCCGSARLKPSQNDGSRFKTRRGPREQRNLHGVNERCSAGDKAELASETDGYEMGSRKPIAARRSAEKHRWPLDR